jgi:hypothetical protein
VSGIETLNPHVWRLRAFDTNTAFTGIGSFKFRFKITIGGASKVFGFLFRFAKCRANARSIFRISIPANK